ncbi:undecaprenyl-phosphate glucose phosphotransferase [Botryobacter ruber]|uniref:undecaprenyl-phosphate glucose phosphotransferase n=1 Tax=Botryobacter ruber TaxID=2171629 RepID=UPI001F0B83EA|nr:undecaprenyl-phosphate glucose phosphotransferase [Botryobacter ruber]
MLLNLVLYVAFVVENPHLLWSNVPDFYKINFLLLNLLWYYCTTLARLYEDVLRKEAVPVLKTMLASLATFFLLPALLTGLLPGLSLSDDFLRIALSLFSFAILLWKVSFLSLRKIRRKFWIEYQKIVIVGANQIGQNLYRHIVENPQLGYNVAGFFEDEPVSEQGQEQAILGKVDDCISYAKKNNVTEVYCALQSSQLEQIKRLMLEADKHMIRFRLVPDLTALYDRNVMLEVYGDMPVLSPRQEPLENKANEIVKRGFDIAFSFIVVVFLLSWFIPLMAIIIKLDSKGPVFFKQLRSGKNNRPFYCLKFRSMTVNADSDSKQACKGDARITRVGAFMRKTSIDELPQFFNVLLGDMSVVGPRPHMIKHTEDYSLLINKFMVRHFLTPGITGWAQVSGYRGETKDTRQMEKRVEADLWYLENWNLLLDLKIIFLTVWNAIRGDEKAY